MRARAAERRAARRRRRLQYAVLALVGMFGVATGWFAVASLPYLTRLIDVRTPPPPLAPRSGSAPAEPMPIPAPVAMLGEPLIEGTLSGEPEPQIAPASAATATAAGSEPVSRSVPDSRDRPAVGTAFRQSGRPGETQSDASPASRIVTPPRVVAERPTPAPAPPPSAAPATVVARSNTTSIPTIIPPAAASEPLRDAPGTPAPADPPAPSYTPPATSSKPAPSMIDPLRARTAVRGTIERYRMAYERLDAAAARAVWPGVDAAALARAFGSLESQRLAFDDCAIEVAGSSADATCTGRASIVPKIGGGNQTVRRTWRFRLAQNGDAWTIASANVR